MHRRSQAIDVQCRKLKNEPIKDISVDDVAAILQAIEFPTQRRFVQGVMRRVFDTAIAKGLRMNNPADARVIGKVVSLSHATQHQPALDWRSCPGYLSGLREKATPAALALEFVIRTGVRKGEALAARFDEIDYVNRVLRLAEDRTKQRRAHDVPLPEAAFKIVLEQKLRHPDSDYIFPGSVSGRRGQRRGRAEHLSHGAFMHLLPAGATVHGFRSSLRSFLGDATDVPFEVAEEVLGHRISRDATVHAYRRTSGLSKRREALQLWNDFLDGIHTSANEGDNVVQFQLFKGAR